MVNYLYGKIYKIEPIVEHEEGDVYYGSTTKQYLSQRMDSHRGLYNAWQNKKAKMCYSFRLFDKFGLENCNICLVENYPCDTKDELLAREAYYIRNNKCVNKCIPGRTTVEYHRESESYQRYSKEYHKQPHVQDKVKEYHKTNEKYIEYHKDYCKGYYQQHKEVISKMNKN